MAKVILMCGKICAGKSTYAEKLRKENHAVVLSIDEITLALFDQYGAGEKLDDYVARLEKYFFEKSVQIVESGIDVIFDIGLWTKKERLEAREFYKNHNVENEIHYIHLSNEEWQKRIKKRNTEINEGKITAYYVDERLADKVSEIFKEPERSEVDVWVE